MIRRFRILAAAIAVAAAMTGSLVAPTAIASADPVQSTAQSKYFNTHIRVADGPQGSPQCYRNARFSYEGSRCEDSGFYDAGHTAGFNNIDGRVYYGGYPGGTELVFTTKSGSVLKGTIPSRKSGDFTITEFNVPEFGTLARPGQKLFLNVKSEGPGLTGDAWQDFYLTGNLDIVSPPTGGNGGLFGDFFDDLSGIFGS
ncbi:hypothetical protein [Rhodococcus sp. MEB064]|uniref:hypothetical protein n=1 Tax=Rhodococcus sp. MEB064 TaxID=1587522 RepID=UPI0005ABECF9|nr:hypothetical protein [Rhodococcus sp. MEB064]KIQ17482.1 hypothetical protein RU01_09860 [Rhodococcus sp. MEB064]